jgi:hypothetical protein
MGISGIYDVATVNIKRTQTIQKLQPNQIYFSLILFITVPTPPLRSRLFLFYLIKFKEEPGGCIYLFIQDKKNIYKLAIHNHK